MESQEQRMDDVEEKFRMYFDLLLKWNQKMNLTSITDWDEVRIKHFEDSLLPQYTSTWKAQMTSKRRVVDIGSGAGFPGIPLAILFPAHRYTLVDSLQKRVGFLEMVAKELQLHTVEVVHARAEDVGQSHEYRGKFDVALSRAVAKVNVLAEYLAPLVRSDGFVCMYKGPSVQEELDESEKALSVLNLRLVECSQMELSAGMGERRILWFQRHGQIAKRYPRRAGIPSKEPIS
ncbi:MAG: 16S rRNA (guanine(527)-N(7))-methyltransferase RsmG [Alicyclobacillaceae bacterium]|nr:16S rRNA (guanine(527)-N(7))-methyltransferase RsmG [Alicyclobacillaceae bacterium]